MSVRQRARGAALGAALTGLLLAAAVVSPAMAAGPPGPYFVRGADCGGAEIWVKPPFIAAVDTTAAEDRQAVTWRPVLYKWDGAAWQPLQYHSWATAFWAYDGDGGRYTYNYTPQNILMTQTGYYRIAIQIYWYATTSVEASSVFVWGGSHYTTNGSTRTAASYCQRV